MRPMDNEKVERLFAEVRVEKERIERLISDLEWQGRVSDEDLRYMDGALQEVERTIRRIREKCRESGPSVRLFGKGGDS
ncbi:MAG: hypothetical protein MOGMAGMI_00541 [Candidatus Omnitrophica bacterium]|nr:hypothetical protein [Candidatus Omnitrophota bacterium]